ncbi:hypothetical protein [Salibacterium halotolerans]|uniref:Uncharacterized protein n=1 Tax=Salibacterium halotolerans TaxID=1884432 RepID=A0A1I5KZ16_9BACI|nr:hypothetical protein [Salibacterium halotolerans]SFO90138.1 hypothetical protein SAMN05518683_10134 [Salibacterium halotolerans]
MKHPNFSIYMSEYVENEVDKDLAAFAVRITADERFEDEWETFEFFPHDGRQYVIRSQNHPAKCKGYQLQVSGGIHTETILVKKEEDRIKLYTSRECVLQL